MEDVTVKKTHVMVCRHGRDNSLRIETTRTDTGYNVKATEEICPQCMQEWAAAKVHQQSAQQR